MTNDAQSDLPPQAVLDAFELVPDSLERLTVGIINRTWTALRRDDTAAVLQQVSDIFAPPIHEDIDALTRHIEQRGLLTPRLIPTRSGKLWAEIGGRVWRLQTRVHGHTHDVVASDAHAREAGLALGRFHAALRDFEHEFKHARLGVHDIDRHLATLKTTLARHARHREIAAVEPLADEVLRLAEHIEPIAGQREHVVHGDPKISNILFSDDMRALCLIDLDTVTSMPIALELGDAFRSWCSSSTEDDPTTAWLLSRFEAAMEGYAQGCAGLLTPAEWQALPDAAFRITVELAARFCSDALNESYFNWDQSKHGTSSAHNQARTQGQLALARSIEVQLEPMHAIARRLAGPE